MFFFAGLLLFWALATFGAVLPSSSILIMCVWFAAVVFLSIRQILTRGRLDYLMIAAGTAGGLAILLLGPKLGLWIFAALWAWKAARDYPRSTVRFLQSLVFIGILEAILGLVQYFIAPGWIFGYRNTSGNLVSGTLINKNHFAGLIEVLIPSCIGLGFITVRRYRDLSRSYLYVLAGAVMGLSLAFSLSRMGIFTFLITLLFLSILLLLQKSQRRMALGFGLGLLGLLMTGVLWVGVDEIVQRYADLMGSNALVEEGRAIVFRDTTALIRAFPQGVGIGKYEDFFRRFQTLHPEVLFDHAHNDYLETAAEWGLAPAIAFWIVIGAIFVSLIRRLIQTDSDREKGILLASIGGIFSILVHSLADFNLQIPSNAMLFFSFVGIGLAVLFPRPRVTA